MVKIYCDGGARGNPGPAASAIVVYEKSKLLYSSSKYMGVATNNVAEYGALIMALNFLIEKNYQTPIEIILDSELVSKQMQEIYKVKNANLKELFLKAKNLQSKIGAEIVYKWSPREENLLADQLVNQELDRNKVKTST